MRFRDNVTKDLGFGRGLFFFRGSGGEVEWGFRAIM